MLGPCGEVPWGGRPHGPNHRPEEGQGPHLRLLPADPLLRLDPTARAPGSRGQRGHFQLAGAPRGVGQCSALQHSRVSLSVNFIEIFCQTQCF